MATKDGPGLMVNILNAAPSPIRRYMKKILSIIWVPFGFRSSELAEVIGCEQISITVLYGPRYYAPLRYLVLFFKTLLVLYSRRPEIVYAQNPPVFCPLTCLLYCKLAGARLIV